MAGNLMDNACKWSHGQVRVQVVPQGATFLLTVEDDGPGLTETERTKVGERGERLDESVPGSSAACTPRCWTASTRSWKWKSTTAASTS